MYFVPLLSFAAGIAFGLTARGAGPRILSKLTADNVFLRAQLTALMSRGRPAPRLSPARRALLAALSRFTDWRKALYIVKPETLVRWHRDLHRVLWRRRSRPGPGRPPLPAEVVELIRRIGRENPSWGEERISDELEVKLGLMVSPRTVRKYLPRGRPRPGTGGPGWAEFLRLHAGTVLAADFFTMPTLNALRAPVYVLVIMELTSRRLLYVNVTSHPSTDWVLQQLRQALPQVHPYRFLIHDRDSIFSAAFRQVLAGFRVKALRTPRKTPTANAHCERLIGTIRRECLDYVIALDEGHLRRILREWMRHYNLGRPHSSLGPGLPDPSAHVTPVASGARHWFPEGCAVSSSPVLGGLHHEYRLEKRAA